VIPRKLTTGKAFEEDRKVSDVSVFDDRSSASTGTGIFVFAYHVFRQNVEMDGSISLLNVCVSVWSSPCS
jgi:hypothetical protein